jgi:hypothetical protein
MLNSHLCWNLPAATDVRTRFQTRHRRRISSRPWRRVFFFCDSAEISTFFLGGVVFLSRLNMFYLVEHYELNGYVTAFVFQTCLVSGGDVLRKWDMYNGKFSTKHRIQPTRMEILIVTCFYFGWGNLGLGWCPPKGDMEETQGTIRDPFAPVYSKVPSLGTHVVDVWICLACVYILFLGNNLFLEFLLYYICTQMALHYVVLWWLGTFTKDLYSSEVAARPPDKLAPWIDENW